MVYNESNDLDKTSACFIICATLCLLAVICVWSQKEYQSYMLEHEAIKSGYCQVVSPQGSVYGYHWEKCLAGPYIVQGKDIGSPVK